MKHVKTYLLLISLVVFLTGCDLLGLSKTSSFDVTFTADQTAYEPGETVELTLSNASERGFMVHPTLCDAVLQQRSSVKWEVVKKDGRVCTAVGTTLKPGDEISSERTLSDTLEEGRYRFMYKLIEREEGDRYQKVERIELYTKPFEVQ